MSSHTERLTGRPANGLAPTGCSMGESPSLRVSTAIHFKTGAAPARSPAALSISAFRFLLSVFLFVIPMVALCLIGIAASWLGLRRLDAWCARQLTDTDGQPETGK